MATLPSRSDVSPRASNEDVWIVIAAYNESNRLKHTLEGLTPHYPNVVVVDDGSKDDTADVALGQHVWVLRHILNCGQGAALQTGIDFALGRGAEIIVTFDADGQHDVLDIERLVAPIRANRVDVALGSRFLGRAIDIPFRRWLILKLAILFTRVYSRIDVTDTHNGLRALSRHAAQSIHLNQDRMAHASEILDQIHERGLRYDEVSVTVRYSPDTLAKGQSSWNSVKILGQLLLDKLLR